MGLLWVLDITIFGNARSNSKDALKGQSEQSRRETDRGNRQQEKNWEANEELPRLRKATRRRSSRGRLQARVLPGSYGKARV